MYVLVKVSGAFFSFLSYPYVFRVLGSEGVGKISFATSFSSLFVMLAVLGIPVYGIRECAKVRDDPQQLSRTVGQLLTLQGSATLLALALFILSTRFLPQARGETRLYLIQAVLIAVSAIQVDWVFSALERFSYIALRTMAVKAGMTALIFLLVRRGEDYLWYALLLCGATVVTNLINLYRLTHGGLLPSLRRVSGAGVHLGPILVFFVQTVSITIYTSMDTVMLGFLQNDYAVGLYDASIKIKLILSYLVTSMSGVLMPKLSYYIAKKNQAEYQRTLAKTIAFTLLLSLPILVFFGVMAEECMEVVCGMRDGQSGTLLRVLLPTVFLIGCSSVAGSQMLIPTHREKQAMEAYLVGAGVNLVLNMVLISRWSVVGAAVATLMAEIVVLGMEMWFLRGELVPILRGMAWKTPALAALVPVPLLYLVRNRLDWLPAQLLLSAAVYGIVWLAFLLWRREQLLTELLSRIVPANHQRAGQLRRRHQTVLKETVDMEQRKSPTWPQWLIYVGLALVAVSWMIYFGNANGFWYDEFAQICYSAPPQSLLDTLRIADPTPPLFSLAANLWMRIVPVSERWLLLLPQLAVGGAMVVMGRWCHRFYGFRGGILGVVLLGFSRMVMEQCGFEFRGYGFYLLLAVLTLLLHGKQRENRASLGYACSLIALTYCHLFGVALCLLLGMWDGTLILRKKLSPKTFLPYLAAGAAFLPWGLYFLAQAGSSAMSATADWMTRPSLWDVVKLVTFLCGNHLLVCALFALGCLLAVGTLLKKQKTASPAGQELALSLFLGVALIALVFLYSLLWVDEASLWVKRYFTGLFPCTVFLAVGGGCWLMARWNRYKNWVFGLILVATVPLWLWQNAAEDSPFGAYYHREVAEVLRGETVMYNPTTAVLSSLGNCTSAWAWFYLEQGGTTPEAVILDASNLSTKDLEKYSVIYVDEGYGALSHALTAELDKNYQVTQTWKTLSLKRYELKESR